jgi:hypothetical protein
MVAAATHGYLHIPTYGIADGKQKEEKHLNLSRYHQMNGNHKIHIFEREYSISA